MSDLKKFLKREVEKVILLEKKKSDGPVKKGKLGRGGVKKKIKEAGALASEKPKELMKKLGVSGAPGGASDHDMVVNLVRTAIFGNETMGAAYGGAKINTVAIGDSKKKVVIVTTRKIKKNYENYNKLKIEKKIIFEELNVLKKKRYIKNNK